MAEFSRESRDDDNLGSLAQSARSQQLRSARNLLYFVSGWLFLSVIVNWFLFNNELQKVQGRAPQWAIDQVTRQTYIILGGLLLLAILYIFFALKVKNYPVPITITALVLYIGLQVVDAALAPEQIGKGIIMKVVVIVGLAKSIQAAVAYEAERKKDRSRYDDDREPDDFDRRVARDEEDFDRRDSRRRDDDRDDDRRSKRSQSERDDW